MRIHTIETGFFSTDGGAMFGILPRHVWTRNYPSDPDNRCPMTMRVAYVELGEHRVLFDAGVGASSVPEMSYYRFEELKSLAEELRALGCAPEALTDIVLSHLHFDHCGGLMQQNAAGERELVFPNAVCHVSRLQWEQALSPSLWEQDSFDAGLLNLLSSKAKLHLIENDERLFPGLSVELYGGHTSGQLVSWIESDYFLSCADYAGSGKSMEPVAGDNPGALFVFAGDVVPMLPHLNTLCIAAVDNCARESVDEKRRLLEAVCSRKAQLLFYHEPTCASVGLRNVNGRFVVRRGK